MATTSKKSSSGAKGKVSPAAKSAQSAFSAQLSSAGQAPKVGTVIYVHGIGNKPEAAILKCQWDRALFGAEMGDRTRMAYWVDRERYPTPEKENCADSDQPRPPQPEWPGLQGAAVDLLATEAQEDASLTLAQREQLASLAHRLREQDATAHGPKAKVLPFAPVRNVVTRLLTRLFLHDVRDFLYDKERRERMEDSLRQRLEAGGGPFIVIAHSQGSMIAYNLLRKLSAQQADVRLFLTIGSPLGIKEVQDVLQDLTGSLAIPECVTSWLNVADRLDPVALDSTLADDYENDGRLTDAWETGINPDWQTNPHSANGYLSIELVRRAVREAAGSGFAQVLAKNIIVRDLVREIENGHSAQRFKTLIQLSSSSEQSDGEPLKARRERVQETIIALAKKNGMSAQDVRLQVMQRYVSADLTRLQIETLRTQFANLQIDRIWKNLSKRALIAQSTNVVQARPAQLGYGADGNRINWAVLDTGIAAAHPHFNQNDQTVIEQWDCSQTGPALRVGPKDKGFGTLDKNGHGTHVAGIIAGGMKFGSTDSDRYYGMAPAAKLYGFKVLNDDGEGEDASIIKALDKIAAINEEAGRLVIHGINLSLGGGFDPSSYGCGHTPLCQELRRLWNQGVLVCIAAGNEGYAILEADAGQIASNIDLSIGDPANLDEAIAVGSVHKESPHTFGVSFFSSRGPTADGRMKPDLVAPGERILSAAHEFDKKAATVNSLYVEMSGTSQATPHVSGLLAGFLSVRREFIGYPTRVKQILLDCATSLERDPYTQGRGIPNLVKMLLST